MSADPKDAFYNEEYAFASAEDVKEGRSSNWDFIGNARLKSNWNKYSRDRALKFRDAQAEEIGTLKTDIDKLKVIDEDGLTGEARIEMLKEQGLIK